MKIVCIIILAFLTSCAILPQLAEDAVILADEWYETNKDIPHHHNVKMTGNINHL